MRFANRLQRLEQRRPPAVDLEKAAIDHTLEHLTVAELRDLDALVKQVRASETTGLPLDEGVPAALEVLASAGRQRAVACPLSLEECRTVRRP